MKVYCKRRSDLTDSLLEVAVKLSIAASQMAEAAGTAENTAFLAARGEAERLRDECERVKTEIAQHRLKHGC